MAVFRDLSLLPEFKSAVLTVGTFDGVHRGHRAILEQIVSLAGQAGGESVVVTFDPHPRTVLQPGTPMRVLTPLDDKIELLTDVGIDHIVVVPFTEAFASMTAEEYIEDFLVDKFHPRMIVIGYDHRFGRDRSGDIGLLNQKSAEFGYSVAEIPAHTLDEATVSSTKIRKALERGAVEEAEALLGRRYSVRGTVIEGQKIGRTLGFPTANLHPLFAEQLLPADGVYAATVERNEDVHPAMLNIGFRPTVDGPAERHFEAHLLGFDSDLYGATLTVHFAKRLRDEQKFPSLEALKAQLETDAKAAYRALKDA